VSNNSNGLGSKYAWVIGSSNNKNIYHWV